MENPLVAYFIIRPGLSPGKACAASAHAGQQLQILYETTYQETENAYNPPSWLSTYREWCRADYRKIMLTTVTVDYFEELRKEADIEIIDAGHTEVKPGTCTIIAFIPDYKEKIGPKFKGLPKYTGK